MEKWAKVIVNNGEHIFKKYLILVIQEVQSISYKPDRKNDNIQCRQRWKEKASSPFSWFERLKGNSVYARVCVFEVLLKFEYNKWLSLDKK